MKISLISFSSPSTPVHVRTAKAERRLRESTGSGGSFEGSPEHTENQENREMSPAEKRMMEAEKRASWRRARSGSKAKEYS